MATTALNLHSALGERRAIERQLAAQRAIALSAADGIDQIWNDLIRTPTATAAVLDKLARIRTALRHGRTPK
jgi:hypothetical protein